MSKGQWCISHQSENCPFWIFSTIGTRLPSQGHGHERRRARAESLLIWRPTRYSEGEGRGCAPKGSAYNVPVQSRPQNSHLPTKADARWAGVPARDATGVSWEPAPVARPVHSAAGLTASTRCGHAADRSGTQRGVGRVAPEQRSARTRHWRMFASRTCEVSRTSGFPSTTRSPSLPDRMAPASRRCCSPAPVLTVCPDAPIGGLRSQPAVPELHQSASPPCDRTPAQADRTRLSTTSTRNERHGPRS